MKRRQYLPKMHAAAMSLEARLQADYKDTAFADKDPAITMKRILSSLTVSVLFLSAASSAQAAGNPAKGKQAFAQCAACHKTDASGKSGIGPNLWKVAGRTSGTLPGFKYSPAMIAAKRVWNDKALDAFLAKPATAMPGNRMPYGGTASAADRADIIAYLKTLR